MIVSEVIALAQGTELKQLNIKSDKAAILGFINLGILELHKRFNLVEKEAIITMVADKFNYLLDGTDADVAIDLSANSLLKITEVWNVETDADTEDYLLALNEDFNLYSVNTPEYSTIKIPDKVLVPAETLRVVYRASPNFLLHEKATIPLQPQFLEALLSYIGFKGHDGLRSTDKAPSNNPHYKRFENSCSRVKSQSLHLDDNLASQKFENRGFV